MAEIPGTQRAAVGALETGASARWFYDPAMVHVIGGQAEAQA